MSLNTEMDKLKHMSFKDKIWYVWTYYKFPIIASVICAAVLVSVSATMYKNRFPTGFYCLVINNQELGEVHDTSLADKIAADISLPSNEKVIVDSSLYIHMDEQMSELSYSNLAKVSALSAANELDAMITTEDVFEHYSSSDAYFDLKELLPDDLFLRVEKRLIYSKDSNGNAHPYGIDLSDTEFCKTGNITVNSARISFIVNSTHKDRCIALVDALFPQ